VNKPQARSFHPVRTPNAYRKRGAWLASTVTDCRAFTVGSNLMIVRAQQQHTLYQNIDTSLSLSPNQFMNRRIAQQTLCRIYSILLLCALPISLGHAQGGMGILKRIPGVGDAVTASEMMKDTKEIRENRSLIAGTYRFVVRFDTTAASDSIVLYARTFDKPLMATAGGNFPSANSATAGQMTQGYVLTVVCARNLADLPTDASKESARNPQVGSGTLLTYPFAGDSNSTRAFAVDWILLMPKGLSAETDNFNKRIGDARKGAISSVDGRRKPQSVNNLPVESATTLLAADKSVRIEYALVNKRAFASIRGERISLDAIPRP
jgi:hypothetical protein